MNPRLDPNDSAEQAWQRILVNPDHNGQTWACLTLAIAHADDVSRHVAGSHTGGAVPDRGGPLWTNVAVAAYRMLMGTGAYRQLAVPPHGQVVADETAIRTWLGAPAPGARSPGQTVADALHVAEGFLRDDGQIHGRIARLLAHAQEAGVMRGANTHLELWHVVNDDGELVGHRIGVHRGNVTLASEQFDIGELIDETRAGVDAVQAVLQRAAERANRTHNNAADARRGAEEIIYGHDRSVSPQVLPWARGFAVGGRRPDPAAGTPTPPGPGATAPLPQPDGPHPGPSRTGARRA